MTQENVMSGEATVSPEKKPKKHNRQYTLRESLLGYLFASPWIIGFIALMAFPLFYSLYLSFTNARTSSLFVNFVGWNNYRAILKDSAFWNSLLHTLWFVCLSVPLNLLFSLGIALLLNAKIPGKKFYRVLYYLPTLVTIVAVVFLWKQMLSSSGVVNTMLSWFHISGPDWFNDYKWATPGLVLMGMWSVGGTIIVFLSGLTDCPPELYEAISIDGVGAFAKFFNVTMPSISSIVFYNLLTGTIAAFQTFVQPMLMTGGAYNTDYLGYQIYYTGFTVGRQGYASAMSWLMLVVVAVFVALIKYGQKKLVVYND